MMTYMGKESKGRLDTCIHVTDSLGYTAESDTTLETNYTPIKNLIKEKLVFIKIKNFCASKDTLKRVK